MTHHWAEKRSKNTMPEELDEELGTTEDSLISPEDEKVIGESLSTTGEIISLKEAIKAAEAKILEGSQRRFNEITKDKYDAKREADGLKEEIKLYREKLLDLEKKGVETKEKTTIEGKPKLEDYDDTADHTEALIEWNKKQEREYYDAKLKKIETDGVKSAEEIRKQEINAEFDRGRKDYPDFDKVALNPTLPYSDTLRDIVLNIKDARHVQQYLGAHIDEIDRLSRLPEREAAIEIGKIQAKLTKPKKKDKETEEETTEIAEVINPVEGNEIVSKSDDKLSIAELRKKYGW